MIDFGLAYDTFKSMRDQLCVQVRGGVFEKPDKTKIQYPGIDISERVQGILKRSTNHKESYIALRDAECILAQVEQIRFNASIIKAELKSIIGDKDLNHDSRYTVVSRDLKTIYDKVCDYYDIANDKYKYMLEIVFGLTQVNATINKRVFNAEYTYNYDETKQ